MPELDAESLVDQVTMLGLVSREQLREAMADAEDGSPDAVLRTLLRKGWLTSWPIDRPKQDNRHYMIMEYVEGSNLRDFSKLRVRMKAQQALPLMVGLARGLKYSLDKGVTHRDIKGTNILISNKGVAKLVDFGLATMEGDV